MLVLRALGFPTLLLGAGLLAALGTASARSVPASAPVPVVVDTFPHARHTALACLTCHTVQGGGRGLVFETPRGCDLCHHQAAVGGRLVASECRACHTDFGKAPAAHAEGEIVRRQFDHAQHESTTCATCHVGASLRPSKEQVTCTACHADHHTAARDCASCHRSEDLAGNHERATHRGCDECHDVATVATLVPDRGFCLTCHEPQAKHEVAKECTTCHFLATPGEYRKHLSVPTGS